MKFKTKIFSLICAVIVLGTVSAQTPVPNIVPPTKDATPQPFSYPADLASPTFDQEKHVGNYVQLGVFDIILGTTPLSIAVNVLGGELHFTEDKTPFLCYSAPLPELKTKKKGKTSKLEEEPAEPFYQNLWLSVGSRGEISEARVQKLNDQTLMCPPIPEAYQEISIGGIFINESLKQLNKAELPELSAENEETKWRYWFSLLPSERAGMNEAGLVGVHLEEDLVDQIISVIVPLKAQ